LPYTNGIQIRPDPIINKLPPLAIALSNEVINEAPCFCLIMKVKAEKTYARINTIRIALTTNEIFIFNTPSSKNHARLNQAKRLKGIVL
jgi:hypothetical protein